MINNLPASAGDLGWEDPLEEELATCSGIPAWEIPWTEEPGMLQPMGPRRVRHYSATKRQYDTKYESKKNTD